MNISTYKFKKTNIFPESTNTSSESKDKHNPSDNNQRKGWIQNNVIEEVLICRLFKPCIESYTNCKATNQLRKKMKNFNVYLHTESGDQLWQTFSDITTIDYNNLY